MIIHWFQLISAAVILFIPIGLFHGPKVRYRAIRRTWGGYWRQILTLGLHTADLTRAILGAWLLVEAFEIDPDSALPLWGMYALLSVVVILAVILQLIVCKEPKSINASYAFLIGLIIGLHSLDVSLFAVFATLAFACGARMPMAFYPLLALWSLLLGLLFGHWKLTAVLTIGSCAVLVPWLWAMLFSRALVITYRAKRPHDPA